MSECDNVYIQSLTEQRVLSMADLLYIGLNCNFDQPSLTGWCHRLPSVTAAGVDIGFNRSTVPGNETRLARSVDSYIESRPGKKKA